MSGGSRPPRGLSEVEPIELLSEIRKHCAATGMGITQFGRIAVGDGHLSRRLERMDSVTIRTVERVRAAMTEHRTPVRRRRPLVQEPLSRRPDAKVYITPEEIAFRRDLTELAHSHRLPGETMHQAVKRLGAQIETAQEDR